MSAVINYKIPSRNWELIRDKIGAILFVELDNQYTNYYTQEANIDSVTVEKTNPEDHIEFSTVNVSLAENNFDNDHQGTADGSNMYTIDCYVKYKTRKDQPGDKYAQYKLQRLLGLVWGILKDPRYKTLGYTVPFIKSTKVIKNELRAPSAADAANSAMGRVLFKVDAVENVELMDAIELQSSVTGVKLGLTDYGYQYIYEA